MTNCDEVRVGLSARLDGEAQAWAAQAGLAPRALDTHLSGCRDCRTWLRAAEQLTRAVRVQPVAVPDLTAPILAAAAAERAAALRAARRQAVGRRQILRAALGVTAAVQVLLALPALLAGVGELHTGREAASFDIALAVGFALAAWRPERARAFVPVAFVLAACLIVTSVFDVADGMTALAHEIGHAAALAQAGLLWALSRTATVSREPGHAVTVGP
jgi:predicted anti-sigma-YlaC factor YlaD